MVMNGSGTSCTARVLGISKDTVTSTLKKLKKIVKPINQEYLEKSSIDVEIRKIVFQDELSLEME